MTSGDVGRIIADVNFLPINQSRSAVLQRNEELDPLIFDLSLSKILTYEEIGVPI